MKNKRKCFRCKSTSTDPDVVLYRFPRPGVKNVQRCELWAKYSFPHGPWSSTDFQKKLYSEHRMLCHKHFKPTSFIDFALKKLHKHAAPDAECDETGTENAAHIENPGILGPHLASMDICKTQHATPSISYSTSEEIGTQTQNISRPVLMDITNTLHPPLNIAYSTSKQTPKPPMSPKRKKYYEKARKALKKICRLQNFIKNMKKKDALRVVAADNVVDCLGKRISPGFALLLQGQIKNFSRKSKGRRWSTDDKIIALRLFKRSPACYRLLRRIFCLPAPSSIKKLLGLFNMPPGINESLLKTLKKITKSRKPSDQEYILMFDEMSIRKHLQYNKRNDEIDGFQDHGTHGRTPQEAVKVLVFMIAGIRKSVKQPLAYYLSGANVTADRITVLIKETIRECFKAGLKISATVCDMGGTNRRALTTLGASTERPVITIDGKQVVALFDAPHLLKCFRNMFMKYNIKCSTEILSSGKTGEGLAQWSDIKKFHEVDSSNPNFVYAPTLKNEHLDPNARQKMKVNLAAQVFSHTVAAGMFSKVSEGTLPGSAVVTATLISKMDKLFDLVNSDSPDRRRGKPHATNMSKTSPHSAYFREIKKFFQNMKFVGCPRQPPSLEGWVWTLNGMEIIWNKIKSTYPDVQSLQTRRLQQDALENLFGCIRGNCGSNVNPTTSAFIGGLKTAIMSNLAHISSGNCETDENKAMIENFKALLTTPSSICTESDSSLLPLFHTSLTTENNIEDGILEGSGEIQACAYVCGFLIKNHKNKQCIDCKKILEAQEVSSVHNFSENKEYYDSKKCLHYASKNFIQCVENCASIININLTENASKIFLKQSIINSLPNELFDFLKECTLHHKENVDYIKCSVFYICVKRFCTLKNRKYAEEASKTALKKKIEILKNQ